MNPYELKVFQKLLAAGSDITATLELRLDCLSNEEYEYLKPLVLKPLSAPAMSAASVRAFAGLVMRLTRSRLRLCCQN